MTRNEALRQLNGTWRFETRGGRVAIRDVDLCAAVDEEHARLGGTGSDVRPDPIATTGAERRVRPTRTDVLAF